MGKAKYSVEEKLAWITRILSNEISIYRAARVSGINKATIIDWLRLYEVEGIYHIIYIKTSLYKIISYIEY